MTPRTRSFLIGCALAALLLTPLAAEAQTATPQIVVINGDRVTAETDIGQQVRARLQAAAEDWQQRIGALQTDLQTQQQQLQAQQLTLSPDALATMTAEIEEKQVQLQRMQDDARRTIERMQASGVEEVNAVLIPALEAMAAENGYEIVLDSRLTQTGGLLFYAESIDVTEEFIARVNQASGSN